MVLKLVMDNIVRTSLLLLVLLAGCAYDYDSAAKMHRINYEYNSFVEECEYSDGFLWIDRPFTSRRVQNAPLTVWEKHDAVCTLSHNTSIRMREWIAD